MDNDNSLQPADTRRKALQNDIARRAQELWEQYGRPQDRDLEIWLEAEKQLLGADSEVKTEGADAVSSGQLGESTRAQNERQRATPPKRTGNAPSPDEKKIPSAESVERSSGRGSRSRKSGGR
jgi:hypothetical protein